MACVATPVSTAGPGTDAQEALGCDHPRRGPLLPSGRPSKTVRGQEAVPQGKGNGPARQRASTPGTRPPEEPGSHTHRGWFCGVTETSPQQRLVGLDRQGVSEPEIGVALSPLLKQEHRGHERQRAG